jgi:hypothetical protein
MRALGSGHLGTGYSVLGGTPVALDRVSLLYFQQCGGEALPCSKSSINFKCLHLFNARRRFMEKNDGKTATAADADIVIKLYDLRREAEIRKARNWYANADFSSWEALQKVMLAWGTQENAWFRQVLTYWENAASLVVRGVVDSDLFFDWNGEIIFTYVKIKPYLTQIREASGAEKFLQKTEQLLTSTPELKERVEFMEGQFKKWAEKMKAQAEAQAAA